MPYVSSPTIAKRVRKALEHRRILEYVIPLENIFMASIASERVTENLGRKNTNYDLDNYGIRNPSRVYWNLNAAALYEEIARRNEGVLSDHEKS